MTNAESAGADERIDAGVEGAEESEMDLGANDIR